MTTSRWLRIPAALAATAALLTGCGGGSHSATTAPPPSKTATDARAVAPDRTVHFNAIDFAFVGPKSVPAGLVNLELSNKGRAGHQLALFRLKPPATLASAFAAMSKAGNLEAGRPYGTWIGGPNMVAAGATRATVVQLTPGDYVVACLIPGDDGAPHAAKGMLAPLTVTANPTAAASDGATGLPRVTTQEFSFVLPENFGHGSYVVENKGTMVHELGIAKLHDGATLADVTAYETSPFPHRGTRPYDDVAGTTFLDPGERVRLDLDLAPGHYAVLCFIPTPDGRPHFTLGMIKGFTVATEA